MFKGNSISYRNKSRAMGKIKSLFLFTVIIFLTACSTGRYQHAHDSTPSRVPNKVELKDATPRAEPHSRGGNKDYRVLGKNYKVLKSAQNFEQTGIASWYGRKFHGHLTSNGEIYDMYGMSAAHKNLPLPTYLKVTNLANNKSVIVRVNDRGPFHQSRIIDLSYSAAYKLDMLKTGTAQVKITAITDFNKKDQAIKVASNAPKPAENRVNKQVEKPLTKVKQSYIQVFATSKIDLAKQTASKLAKQYSQTVNYPEHNGIYRIQIGPIIKESVQQQLLQQLKANGFPNAYLRRL